MTSIAYKQKLYQFLKKKVAILTVPITVQFHFCPISTKSSKNLYMKDSIPSSKNTSVSMNFNLGLEVNTQPAMP